VAGTVSPDSEIWRIISERVDAKRSTGIVVGVIDPGGRTQVFGYGDPGSGQFPLDAVSVFEIGSITNVFTAILLADMGQRGEARLQDLVARFLPPAVRVPAWGERQIELVDLATHTSGLPRLPANWRPTGPANPLAGYTAGQLYDFLSDWVLTREPSSQHLYSTRGSACLAMPWRRGPQLVTRSSCASGSWGRLLERVPWIMGLDLVARSGLTPGRRCPGTWPRACHSGSRQPGTA
jgi:serine-type D-Ala-D-Ala carboxypeptidase/endopeptidase